MDKTNPAELMLGALVVLLIGVAGLAVADIWISWLLGCGQSRVLGLGELLAFIGHGLNARTSGISGCTPPSGLTWTVGVLLVLGVVAGGLALYGLFIRWRDSDRQFVKKALRREGIAQAHEVKTKAGTKALASKAKSIRPQLEKPQLKEVGTQLGWSQGKAVWSSMEDSCILLGPPRSGKGFYIIINQILDAPGAVVTTSTRGDNAAATIKLREKIGPCTVFDPQGLSGVKSTLKWHPAHGCEDPVVAGKRAETLIGATGLGKSSNNQEWAQQATIILRYLLHAAALEKVPVREFARWGQSPSLASDAVEILNRHPKATPGWGQNLNSELVSDPKTVQSKWMGVLGATEALNVPAVAETLDPKPGEPILEAEEFIRSKGTLYLLGSKSGGSASAPFLIALMDEIVETARKMAMQSPGNRLDPPMKLVLDEIANMAPWNSLPQIMADGGGSGISTTAVFQSPSQARGMWGRDDAQALIDSAILQIQLGGSNNAEELRYWSELMGSHKVTDKSRSWSAQGTTHSEQSREKQVLAVDELRRIPSGWGLLMNRNARPILMQMVKWIDRKDAAEIKASQKEFLGMMEIGA